VFAPQWPLRSDPAATTPPQRPRRSSRAAVTALKCPRGAALRHCGMDCPALQRPRKLQKGSLTVTRPDPGPDKPRRQGSLLTGLRNNFLAGIIVIAPIGLTVWLIWTVVGWVDSWVLPFVPAAYQPEALLNWALGSPEPPVRISVRGVGVVFFLVFTLLIGWIAKGLVGRSFIRWGEELVGRLPVIRSVYNALKQIAETVFSQSESNFEKPCLVEFPRSGMWAVAFVSKRPKGEIRWRLEKGDEFVTVFMPTTPNPTTGFLMFVARSEVIILDMKIEDAAKVIISAGLVYPEGADSPASGAIALPVARPD